VLLSGEQRARSKVAPKTKRQIVARALLGLNSPFLAK
jgi:hypothetical protein